MSLRVIAPGFLTTVQDEGRAGYERFGVPASGPMDWFALRAGNRLVGNDPGAAGLEFALEGPAFEADRDVLIAVTGRGFRLWVQGRRIGLWMAAWARRGERIEVRAEGGGRWGCLAVAGGIATPPLMGSRSTYLRGGFGGLEGRALQAGDSLPLGEGPTLREIRRLAGRRLLPENLPPYADEVTVPVVLGPQRAYFSETAVQTFLSAAYTVTAASDRMGYRLDGPPLERVIRSELLSEGMPAGSVQVPAGGQPVMMMADRPTTGGYPKIGVVARAGLPLAAQVPLGAGRVRFVEVSAAQAQAAYRAMLVQIEQGME